MFPSSEIPLKGKSRHFAVAGFRMEEMRVVFVTHNIGTANDKVKCIIFIELITFLYKSLL